MRTVTGRVFWALVPLVAPGSNVLKILAREFVQLPVGRHPFIGLRQWGLSVSSTLILANDVKERVYMVRDLSDVGITWASGETSSQSASSTYFLNDGASAARSWPA